MPKIASDGSFIRDELYPKVVKNMTPANVNKFKRVVGEFVNVRAEQLYDTCPCDRIYAGEDDVNALFKAFDMTKNEVLDIMKKTYYWKMSWTTPVTDEGTVLLLNIVRYFIIKKMDKELELALIYLCFSGKFYASIHYRSYPTFAPSEYRHVMEYVVNTKLSNKFDLKIHGSVLKSILSIAKTWVETYTEQGLFKDFEDEDVVYLIQQLHTRIGSFTKNIAEVYHPVYKSKEYMTYDSDDLSENNYHLADNDSFKLDRYTESAMNHITGFKVDYKRCMIAADNKIKVEELKSIIETILDNENNLVLVKELIQLLIVEYFQNSKDKDITNIKFISSSISVKPNSKNPNVLRIKEILEGFLDDNSPTYRKRKSRLATKSAYNKALLTYFVLTIHASAKGGE